MLPWRFRMALVFLVPALYNVAPGAVATQEPESVPASDPVAATAARTTEAYETLVTALEREQGAYSDALGESLWSLAQAQRDAGQINAAAQTLNRCLHIERAMRGLYDLGQIRVLDALIEIQAAREDWRAVGAAYALIEWLVRRNYADDDPRQLPTLERLRDWHRRAYAYEDGLTLEEHYYAERALIERGIRILTRQTGDARAATCHWVPGCCTEPRVQNPVCTAHDID
jgi:hypothetical protein